MSSRLSSQEGFTYIAALVAVVIMGILAARMGVFWSDVMRRDREEEMIFRGLQIRNAIERWNTPKTAMGEHPATPLRDLKDLLSDPRTPARKRYLRRLYDDPLTGEEWNVVRDTALGVVGVYSKSREKPVKVANFPPELADFEGKEVYEDWKFIYRKGMKNGIMPKTPVAGTPTTPAGGRPAR